MKDKYEISEPFFDGESWRVDITTTHITKVRLCCDTKEKAAKAAQAWCGANNGDAKATQDLKAAITPEDPT